MFRKRKWIAVQFRHFSDIFRFILIMISYLYFLPFNYIAIFFSFLFFFAAIYNTFFIFNAEKFLRIDRLSKRIVQKGSGNIECNLKHSIETGKKLSKKSRKASNVNLGKPKILVR